MRGWRMPWPRCTWPPRRGTSTCSSTWWRSPGATYTLEPRMGWRRSMLRRRWVACPASSGWSSNRWNNWFWWHWLRGWQLILTWFFPRGVTIFSTWPDFFSKGIDNWFFKGGWREHPWWGWSNTSPLCSKSRPHWDGDLLICWLFITKF